MKLNAKFLTVSVLILVLLAGLSGCLPAQKAGLSDQQVASVTENILKALDKIITRPSYTISVHK